MSVNKFGQHSQVNYKLQYLAGRSGNGYVLTRNNDLDVQHKRLTKISKDIIDSSDIISLHYLNMHLKKIDGLKQTLQSDVEQYYKVKRHNFLKKLGLSIKESNKAIESELNNSISKKSINETVKKLWKEDRSMNKMLDLETSVTELSNGLIEYQAQVELLKETFKKKFKKIVEELKSERNE
jgi:hypothetical protein